MSFSERMGYSKVRSVLQLESVDEALVNRLWNLIRTFCFPDAADPHYLAHTAGQFPITNRFLQRVWHGFLRRPIDEVPFMWHAAYERLRNEFKILEWHKTYDFLEFIRNSVPKGQGIDTVAFANACNQVLEEEMSGYRFVGNEIAQIVDEQEWTSTTRLMGTDRQPRPNAQHRRLPRLERSRPLPEIPRTFIARPEGVAQGPHSGPAAIPAVSGH